MDEGQVLRHNMEGKIIWMANEEQTNKRVILKPKRMLYKYLLRVKFEIKWKIYIQDIQKSRMDKGREGKSEKAKLKKITVLIVF